MGYDFDFSLFDSGLGDNELYDALADVAQSIREDLRENYPDVLTTMKGPDKFRIQAIGEFQHNDQGSDPTWGQVSYSIAQHHPDADQDPENNNNTWLPFRDARLVLVSRKEVWKQLPGVANANPKNIQDWAITPSPLYIKLPKQQEKQPVIEMADMGLGKDKKPDTVPDKVWAGAWALAGVATSQPHFRYFSHIKIRGLNHSSASDPNAHVSVKLMNKELKDKGQVVNAHIYNDLEFNYMGHRIFVGSPVAEPWDKPKLPLP